MSSTERRRSTPVPIPEPSTTPCEPLLDLLEEHKDLRKSVDGLSAKVANFELRVDGVDLVQMSKVATDMGKTVSDLNILINGDPHLEAPGLRSQIKETAQQTAELIKQRNQIKWILVGIGVAGGINIAAVVDLINKVASITH